MRPDIYELLAAQQASATNQEQLNAAVKSTFIDKSNIEFWAGVITVARALNESRTFANGNLPVHTTGKVETKTLGASTSATYTPEGTEIWAVFAMTEDQCSFAVVDGNGDAQFITNDVGASGTTVLRQPIYLSSSLSLLVSNDTGTSKDPSFAYYKVSL